MERLEFERVVSTKIRSNLNEDFLNIISIPCFHNINEYTEYIKERVFNMFNNKDDDKKQFLFKPVTVLRFKILNYI